MLLISDLHLDPARDDITRALVRFLRERAASSRALYVLGDLFEVWIGDDAESALANLVAEEFARLASSGCEVCLMHGNRDFLLGAAYAARCGARLIDEPCLLTRGARRLALLHGDILCTHDTRYQEFRRLVRNPTWQEEFLAQPVASRQAFANQARAQSREATGSMDSEIMDVTQSAVLELFTTLQVDTIVHGHTHRPARHRLVIPGTDAPDRPGERIVLGDWHTTGWYAQIDEKGDVGLEQWPLA